MALNQGIPVPGGVQALPLPAAIHTAQRELQPAQGFQQPLQQFPVGEQPQTPFTQAIPATGGLNIRYKALYDAARGVRGRKNIGPYYIVVERDNIGSTTSGWKVNSITRLSNAPQVWNTVGSEDLIYFPNLRVATIRNNVQTVLEFFRSLFASNPSLRGEQYLTNPYFIDRSALADIISTKGQPQTQAGQELWSAIQTQRNTTRIEEGRKRRQDDTILVPRMMDVFSEAPFVVMGPDPTTGQMVRRRDFSVPPIRDTVEVFRRMQMDPSKIYKIVDEVRCIPGSARILGLRSSNAPRRSQRGPPQMRNYIQVGNLPLVSPPGSGRYVAAALRCLGFPESQINAYVADFNNKTTHIVNLQPMQPIPTREQQAAMRTGVSQQQVVIQQTASTLPTSPSPNVVNLPPTSMNQANATANAMQAAQANQQKEQQQSVVSAISADITAQSAQITRNLPPGAQLSEPTSSGMPSPTITTAIQDQRQAVNQLRSQPSSIYPQERTFTGIGSPPPSSSLPTPSVVPTSTSPVTGIE